MVIFAIEKEVPMGIVFGLGIISFTLVGLLWIISSIFHRPLIGWEINKIGKEQGEKDEIINEDKAAVTVATWTILHPPS